MKLRLCHSLGSLLLFLSVSLIEVLATYYQHYRCFGTGDCIITTNYMGGGFNDEYHRWLIECGDGEAAVGIFDSFKSFMGIGPHADVTYGLLEQSNFRIINIIRRNNPYGEAFYCTASGYWNITKDMREYYCYDKHFPVDTVDTFVTGYYSATNYDPAEPTLQKCCRTPPGYRIDYNRCQWKYTHDKNGEHYDGFWLVRCDTHFVMTGTGMARNPWDNQEHYVWIQVGQTNGRACYNYKLWWLISYADLTVLSSDPYIPTGI